MPARKKAKATTAPPEAAIDENKEPSSSQPSQEQSKAEGNNSQDSVQERKEKPETEQSTSTEAKPVGTDPAYNDSDSIVSTGRPRSTKSWYGSWPRAPKAAAAAEIVSESVSATRESLVKTAAKTRALKASPRPTPSPRNSQPYLSPSRSLPVTGITTKLSISSNGPEEANEDQKKQRPGDKTTQEETPKTTGTARETDAPKTPSRLAGSISVKNQEQAKPSTTELKTDQPQGSAKSTKSVASSAKSNGNESKGITAASDQPQSSWTSWFGRGEIRPKDGEEATAEPLLSKKDNESKQRAKEGNKHNEEVSSSTKDLEQPESPSHRRNSDPNPQPPTDITIADSQSNRSSWLGLWGSNRGKTEQKTPLLDPKERIKDSARRSTESLPLPSDKTKDKTDAEEVALAQTNAKADSPEPFTGGSSWAFWSRAPASSSKENIGSKGDIGELAVSGSTTESQPTDAVVGAKGIPETAKQSANTSLGKRNRPTSVEFQVSDDKKSKSSKATVTDVHGNTASGASASDKPGEKRPASKGSSQKNLLLPLFKQTYPTVAEKWSLLQHISKLLYGKSPPAPHPSLIKEPTRIKNALAIGVHGYFPAALVQTVLGRPTGTSVKFAEYGASAIHRLTESQGYQPKNVDKIALEGEGKIEERLDNLWKLLLNWIDTIRKADFIIVACHSQGVPVAISLVAKLIGFGCVNGARVGICAMAGVNLGPFVEYKSRFIGGSAGELFEFAQPESRVSRGYETALDTVVRFGAKVTYVGSLDDQLVSLHSSTFGTAQHPHIYRAVWIDGRLHVPDFLTHLVGFALKLRNLGISDHGLIRELSNPLAGSLVGGEGHSRLYEDPSVYDLAVQFVLETTSEHTSPLHVDKPPPLVTRNPYILPFAMRGLLEEDFVRKELSTETVNLLQQFDDWKPQTKVLQDVKYRLEGIRSKL